MVESDKERVLYGEGAGGQKRTFGQKVKHHYRKWWWAHLIAVVVVTLVITLPLVYVAYPHIAQDGINNAQLVVLSQSALNPAPDSFDLGLQSVFVTKSKYHPQLDAFNASLSLEGSDEPFIAFESPALKATNGTEAHVNQRVQITNMNAYTAYAMKTLASKEYRVVLRGKGGLKQGGLPKTTVDYHQHVTVKGFDGLSEIKVLSMTLLKDGYADGTNTLATISIPNPTVITLDLGNVSLSMFGPAPKRLPLGDTLMLNTKLVPGQNIIHAHVVANQTSIVNVVQEKQYHCGVFPATIKGNNATVNGKILPYYTTALRANTIQTTLNVSETFIKAGYGWVIGECS